MKVNIHGEAEIIVRFLASEVGVEPAEIIREALALRKFVHEKEQQGGKFMVQIGDEIRDISWSWSGVIGGEGDHAVV